eukprot:sb/3479233/
MNFAHYQALSGAIIGLMIVPATIGNLLITVTMVAVKKKNPGYFLISCQAVVDFIVGTFCMGTVLYSCITGDTGKEEHAHNSTDWVLVGGTDTGAR